MGLFCTTISGGSAPQQPSYSEGMADAMKAQMEMLTGKTLGEGEGFEELYASALGRGGGTLADILREFEAPLRKETAQLDTDVLRQTLLGDYRQPGMAGATGAAGVAGAAGAAPPAGQFIRDGNVIKDTETGQAVPQKDWMVEKGYMEQVPGITRGASGAAEIWTLTDTGRDAGFAPYFAKHSVHGDIIYASSGNEGIADGTLMVGAQTKPEGAAENEYFYDTQIHADGAAKPLSGFTGKIFEEVRGPTPAPTPAPTPGTGEAGPAVREGTGMLDLFGPTEAGMVTKQIGSEKDQFEQYVQNYPDLRKEYEENVAPGITTEAQQFEQYVQNYPDLQKYYEERIAGTGQSLADWGREHYEDWGGKDKGRKLPSMGAGQSMADWGRQHYEQHGEAKGRTLPAIGETIQVARRAGFDPQTGEFLGLTTLGADVSEQLARRQRAADIYDVKKLGPQATEAYRQQGVQKRAATLEDVTAGRATEVGQDIAVPGTGIAGTLAEARRLGPGGAAGYSAMPSDPLFSGAATREGGLRKVAQELGATTPTIEGGRIGGDYRAFDPETGAAFDVKAKEYGTDPLRMAMLQQVQEGLGEGLTEREQRTLREAARSRATAMGRTFDPTATIDELKIQMMEDEARRAQRLQQAQSVLGQEAQIQTSDLGRDVQAQLADLQTQQAGIGRELGAAESDVERAMRQQAMSEQYRQAGLGQERAAAAQMVGLEQATGADPFQAILGRPSGAGAPTAQQLFTGSGYGLDSGPQYLNPEAGLGYISQAAANEASMWGAGQQAQAGKQAGLMGMLGSLGSAAIGLCWVAREVYGAHNPAWLDFREWMLLRAPSWFRALYIGYGERFAKFISDKPRLKARIRGWMDTKIGRV